MIKFCQCLTELYAQNTIMAGYYSLMFLLEIYNRVMAFGYNSKFVSAQSLENKLVEIYQILHIQ